MILTVVATIISVVAMAQTFGEETVNGTTYTVVNMQSESANLDEIKILLEPAAAKKFIKNLRKLKEKVASWTETANKMGVKSYRKTVDGSYSYSKLTFCNTNGNNIADYNYNNYLTPYFNVDSEGNSHLILGGYYSGYNSNDAGLDYEKRTKFFFYVNIDAENLDTWVNNLEIASNNAQNKKHVNSTSEIYYTMK